MQALALRPRSATEIVDASFRLCRAHYGVFLSVTAVILAPALLLKIILPAQGAGIADLLQNLLLPVADGALIAVASDVYLGRNADAAAGLRAVRGRVWSLVWTAMARGILVILGLLLFIVPGVFLLASTFAVPMVIMLEGRSGASAFTRSQVLAEGDVWHVIRTVLLLILVVFGMMIGVGIAVAIAVELLGAPERVLDLAIDAALLLLYPLFSVGGTLLYYDLRIRKEGFDLEMMARDLGVDMPDGDLPGIPAPRPIG
jgi:hypothetical protein